MPFSVAATSIAPSEVWAMAQRMVTPAPPPRHALGVMPIGTMNVFSKELAIPADLEAAWNIITEGATREVKE